MSLIIIESANCQQLHAVKLFTCALLFCTNLCNAQEPDKSHFYKRFYVDAQIASHYYVFKYSAVEPKGIVITPWCVNVGYYLTPRIAVQMGLLHNHENSVSINTYYPTSGPTTDFYREDDRWNTSIPVLLRFTLVRNLSRRFKVDVIAGGAFGYSKVKTKDYQIQAGQTSNYKKFDYQQANIFGSVGLSGRYIFSKHWEIVVDYTRTRNLADISTFNYLLATGQESPWFGGYAFGVRYRFNLKKPVSTSTMP